MVSFTTSSIQTTTTANSERHIVDVLIRERCQKLAAHPAWPILRPFLYSILGYRKAVRIADAIADLNGPEAMDYLSDLLRMKMDIVAPERIPHQGGFILAPNHPTGIADGVAVWNLLTPTRRDIAIFTNRDAIRVHPQFEEVFIPVEWMEEKKSRARARETLRSTAQAFREEKAIVLFPSGRLAFWNNSAHRLMERPWQSTIFSLARKQNVPIIPLHIHARNSGMFYLFSRLSTELRDITLFHELLNKRGTHWHMTVGKPIDPLANDHDAGELATRLQHFVELELPKMPDATFSM